MHGRSPAAGQRPVLGALYALIAVGYTVVYGIIQLINFAHGEIFMIGAFGAFATWFVVPGAARPRCGCCRSCSSAAWSAAVGVALLMERFAYRPLRNAPRLAPLITAIGVSVFLQEAVRLFFGRIPGFPDSKRAIPFPQIDVVTGAALRLGERDDPAGRAFTLVALVVCTVFLYFFVNKTRTGPRHAGHLAGPRHRPADGHQRRPDHHGRLRRRRRAGGRRRRRAGLRYTNIDFRMGFLAGLKAFTAAVLGGIGNINGAVVGGLVLGVVEVDGDLHPGQFGGSAWKDVWAFVLLILVLVFRPQGLLGARVVDRA